MSIVVTDEQGKANISANVSRLLGVRGWNQNDLAEATGESKMTISRVARGRNVPSATILKRIAEALDTSVDILLAEPPENFRQNS